MNLSSNSMGSNCQYLSVSEQIATNRNMWLLSFMQDLMVLEKTRCHLFFEGFHGPEEDQVPFSFLKDSMVLKKTRCQSPF